MSTAFSESSRRLLRLKFSAYIAMRKIGCCSSCLRNNVLTTRSDFMEANREILMLETHFRTKSVSSLLFREQLRLQSAAHTMLSFHKQSPLD